MTCDRLVTVPEGTSIDEARNHACAQVERVFVLNDQDELKDLNYG